MSKALTFSVHHPLQGAQVHPIRAHLHLEADHLIARFEVDCPTIYAKDTYGPEDFPYEFDVVELFITTSPTGYPYYEYEVTPLNQTFEVMVDWIDNKKIFNRNVSLGMKSSASVTPGKGWTAEMRIPLKVFASDVSEKNLRGAAYGILGAPPRRVYYSTSLPAQDQAQFHQPEYFRPLL